MEGIQHRTQAAVGQQELVDAVGHDRDRGGVRPVSQLQHHDSTRNVKDAREKPGPEKYEESRLMIDEYLETVALVERLHRVFMRAVRVELERAGIHDVNNVQALLVYNIGDSTMAVTDLTKYNCYLGSNVSYNVKKLVDIGYIEQTPSPTDRRVTLVTLTPKGRKLRDRVLAMHRRHIEQLEPQTSSLMHALATLDRFEKLWGDAAHRATV
jgi:DNA-binding MarR family transcriptional regulator